MSKSAPSTTAAQLRLSSSWDEASRAGQLTRTHSKMGTTHQIIYDTPLLQAHTETNCARRWSMLMCVLCGLSAFSLHTSLFLSPRLPLLSFCPFALSLSLSLHVRVMSDLFLQCDAQRKWEASPGQARNMPHTRTHTVEQTCCVNVLNTVATRYARYTFI